MHVQCMHIARNNNYYRIVGRLAPNWANTRYGLGQQLMHWGNVYAYTTLSANSTYSIAQCTAIHTYFIVGTVTVTVVVIVVAVRPALSRKTLQIANS